MVTVDWEDLRRLASDDIYFEECEDELTKVFETKNLSQQEFNLAYDIYVLFMTTYNESNPDFDSYDTIVAWDSLIATKAYLDPRFTEFVWNHVGPGLWWADQQFRDNFFYNLSQNTDISSKLLIHILQMVKEHGEGLSQSNVETLKQLKYFKPEMLDRFGIEISGDEE